MGPGALVVSWFVPCPYDRFNPAAINMAILSVFVFIVAAIGDAAERIDDISVIAMQKVR